MNYKCLILDHDDTMVESTPHIHYPAHIEVMKALRPGKQAANLEQWFLKNFSPGIMEYMKKDLAFSDEEIREEYRIWREYSESRIPPFFPGLLEIMDDFKKAGGIITVVSHSDEDRIRRDYSHAGYGHLPGLVFGWDFDEKKRKPHPYPVLRILEHYGLQPSEALILDDLKPAVEMSLSKRRPHCRRGMGT